MREALFQFFFGRYAEYRLIANGLGNGWEVDVEADSGLATYGIVGTIVEHDVDVIPRSLLGDDGHAAHVHDRCTISIETPHSAVLFLQGNAKGNLRSVAHGTDCQEVTFMAFILRRAILKEFTGDHSCGRDYDVLFTKSTCYYLNGIFSR